RSGALARSRRATGLERPRPLHHPRVEIEDARSVGAAARHESGECTEQGPREHALREQPATGAARMGPAERATPRLGRPRANDDRIALEPWLDRQNAARQTWPEPARARSADTTATPSGLRFFIAPPPVQ